MNKKFFLKDSQVMDYISALESSWSVVLTNLKGDIVYVNDFFCQLTGFQRSDLIGKSTRLLNSKHHNKNFFEKMWKCIRAGETWRGDIFNKRADGHFYWVDATIIPIFDDTGKNIIKYLSIRYDITSIKNLEERLAFTEQEIIESKKLASFGSWSYSYTENRLELSDDILKLFDRYYDPNNKEYTHEKVSALLFDGDFGEALMLAQQRPEFIKEFYVDDEQLHLRRYFRARGTVEKDDHGRPIYIQGSMIDITEQHQAQLEASEASNVLETTFNFLPGALSTKIPDGNYMFANKEFLKLHNLSEVDVLGTIDEDFLDDDLVKERKKIEEIVLKTGRLVRRKEVIKNKVYQTYVFPTKNTNAEVIYINYLSMDITKQVRMEEKQDLLYQKLIEQKEEMLQSSKLATVGMLASNMSHEIKNPLAVIYGSLNMIKKAIGKEEVDLEKIKKSVETAEKTVERIVKIVEGMKSMARGESEESLDKLLLFDFVEGIKTLTEKQFRDAKVPITFDFPKENIELITREVQLTQVVVNLINNAFDALKEIDSSDKWVRFVFEDKEDAYYLKVIDSGKGIPEEIQSQIMNPFFTTKKVGEGTGIGLSISKDIIEKLGGDLYIDNNSPQTCFVVKLLKKQPVDQVA